MAFTISRDGDQFFLRGYIDETADLSPLLKGLGVSRLNFSAIEGFNSMGVRRYSEFVGNWGTRKFTYCQCPVAVIDAMILVPLLLGPEENTARIESFAVNYVCGRCDVEHAVMFRDSELTAIGEEVFFPKIPCPRCQVGTVPSEDTEMFGSLLSAGALKVPQKR